MRKLREVLRLRFELKLGYQQIGRSCSIGVSTVHKYLKRAEASGLSWPLPEDWNEARVEALVFPRREPNIAEKNPARTPPDFASIHEQLRSSKYVTLQLLWEEYRQFERLRRNRPGSRITRTSSCSDPLVLARVSWPAHWRRRLAATAIRRCTRAPPHCSAI